MNLFKANKYARAVALVIGLFLTSGFASADQWHIVDVEGDKGIDKQVTITRIEVPANAQLQALWQLAMHNEMHAVKVAVQRQHALQVDHISWSPEKVVVIGHRLVQQKDDGVRSSLWLEKVRITVPRQYLSTSWDVYSLQKDAAHANCGSGAQVCFEEAPGELPVADSEPLPQADAPGPEPQALIDGITADLKARRLMRPQGNNALNKVRRLREIMPDHDYALNGERYIVQVYMRLVRSALKSKMKKHRPIRIRPIATQSHQIQQPTQRPVPESALLPR